MKKPLFILILFALVQIVCAQKHEWSSPFVGYSTTKVLTLDKVEFEKGKTLLHVTASASGGNTISVSETLCHPEGVRARTWQAVHDARQREGAFHDAVSTAAC